VSLVDDLKGLDLSAVRSARGGITAAVSGDELRSIVGGGAVTSALGELGAALDGATGDPSEWLKPLVAVFGELSQGLGGQALPVGDLAKAVSEGGGIVGGLLGPLADDPLAVGAVLGRLLPDALESVTRAAGNYHLAGIDELGRFTDLVAGVAGPHTDPAALAELALEVLAPFRPSVLRELRGAVDGLLDATAALRLPATRTQGLVARLDAVTAAAAARDGAAVTRALADLDRGRVQLLEAVGDDLVAFTATIDRLPVGAVAGALSAAGAGLAAAEQGILELYEDWRADLANTRALVDAIDPAAVTAELHRWLDALEAFLRAQFVGPANAGVDLVVGKVRELFAHLPIVPVREAVRDALHTAAQAITGADLDGPVEEVRAVLGRIADALSVADLGGQVRAALGRVTDTLHHALDGVIDALHALKAAIESVAGPASEVLGRAVAAVQAFQGAVTDVTGALDALNLTAATDQVLAKIRQIREAVEGVVSNVPLPEPVRPLVAQLADQLEALNFDTDSLQDVPVLEPMLSVVGQLQLSDTLGTTVHEGLSALRDAVAAVVPQQLIEDVRQEIDQALEVVRGFDPATLLSGVTDQLHGLADRIAAIDLASLGEAAHEPFQTLLDAWDELRPGMLLEPVAEAYRSVFSGISLPGPDKAAEALGGLFDGAGEQVGASAAAPLAKLGGELSPAPGAGGSPGTDGTAGAGAASGAAAPPPGDEVTDLRPGDVIRLFGYLPARLREALAALEAGPAGQALTAIDNAVGGLARDLRRAAVAIAAAEQALDTGLDELLAPLATAHLRAQVALHAGGFDGDTVVARCGPGPVRADLGEPAGAVRARAGTTAARHAAVAPRLLATADALDACVLARITTSVDDLLAALDPEPLAVELDELVFAVLRRAPELIAAVGEELAALGTRAQAMITALNPTALAGRLFAGVLGAFQEQLSLLDPRVLAAELDEVHAAVRDTLAKYDPQALVAELTTVRDQIVTTLRGLDPAALLGDLSGLTGLVDKVADAVPTDALSGLPDQLTALDEAFAGLDLDALLDRVSNLGPEVLAAFGHALEGVRTEIVALLDSLRYASGSVEAHAEVR
jgi:hypothetical protein